MARSGFAVVPTVAVFLMLGLGTVFAQTPPLHKLDEPELQARLMSDVAAVERYRQGLHGILAFVRERPDLFPAEKQKQPRLLDRAQRQTVVSSWQAAMDYLLALDSLGQYHRDFYRLKNKNNRQDAFLITRAALLAQYRFALDLLATVENDPTLDTVLNEPVPELGIAKDTLAAFRYRFLHVGRALEFASLQAAAPLVGGESHAGLRALADDDARAIAKAGIQGPNLTARNGLRMVERGAFKAWFPFQAGVAQWMGDVKVHRRDSCLVTAQQIAAMTPWLEPGDVLLERREWYLSNVGLPGYWPHAALYVGTPEERRTYFADPQVQAWGQGQGAATFEELLEKRFPKAYAQSLAAQEENHLPRVVEAMSEGVVFTTLEHSAAADSLVVLRPRLSKADKAAAVLRAFGYAGRPYDFNFDFRTDAELVCTELIYKSYEPAADRKGLCFPLVDIMGRLATPANDMVRQFDEQCGTAEQQFDFVLFLDGHERQGAAVEATLEAFRQSWRRPKWHMLAQAVEKSE